VQLATALAVAEAPRRIAARRSRAASPDARRSTEPHVQRVVEAADSGQRMAVADSLSLPKRSNPFASPPQETLPSHPWPRAVLPGTNTGAFTAGYSTGTTGEFYPFEPHNGAMPEAQVPAGDGQH
jgi:hypothetical protein